VRTIYKFCVNKGKYTIRIFYLGGVDAPVCFYIGPIHTLFIHYSDLYSFSVFRSGSQTSLSLDLLNLVAVTRTMNKINYSVLKIIWFENRSMVIYAHSLQIGK